MLNARTDLPTPQSWAFKAAAAPSPEDVWRQYQQVLTQIGFENAAYVSEAERFKNALPSPEKILGHMISPQWMEELRRMDDVSASFKVAAASSVGLSVTLSPEAQLRERDLSTADRRALSLLRDFGLQQGWTFPALDQHNQVFSTLLIDCSSHAEEQAALIAEHRRYLTMSVIYLREGLLVQALARQAQGKLLTGREAECMALVASGLTGKALAATLGIANSTAVEYITNATRKLKAANRAQAASRAMLYGMF